MPRILFGDLLVYSLSVGFSHFPEKYPFHTKMIESKALWKIESISGPVEGGNSSIKHQLGNRPEWTRQPTGSRKMNNNNNNIIIMGYQMVMTSIEDWRSVVGEIVCGCNFAIQVEGH